MRITLLSIIALLFSTALIQTSNGLQGTLLPIRADIETFTALSIGIMGSAFYVGLILGCTICPWMVVRVGHIRSFTAFAAIASVSVLLHILIINEVTWWLARALSGLCFAGMQMVIESWLNDRATNASRGRILSFYTLINLTLIIAGQQLISISHPTGFILFIFASILLSLAVIPVALTKSPTPTPVARAQLRILWQYSISPAGVIGALCVGLATGAFWTLGPLFALDYGLTVEQVTWFMSMSVLGGVLALWPLGWISDLVDRRLIITFASVGSVIIAVVIITHLTEGLVWLYALTTLFGAFSFPLYALCLAHANDYVGTNDALEISGGLLLLYSIGAALGPLIGSSLMYSYNYYMLFYFTAAIHFILALLICWRMFISTSVDPARKDNFVAIPKTSPTVNELDPRTHNN